jgi:hypothetical protein
MMGANVEFVSRRSALLVSRRSREDDTSVAGSWMEAPRDMSSSDSE